MVKDTYQKLTQFALLSAHEKKGWMHFYYHSNPIIRNAMDLAKQNNLSEEETLQLCVYALMCRVEDLVREITSSANGEI